MQTSVFAKIFKNATSMLKILSSNDQLIDKLKVLGVKRPTKIRVLQEYFLVAVYFPLLDDFTSQLKENIDIIKLST